MSYGALVHLRILVGRKQFDRNVRVFYCTSEGKLQLCRHVLTSAITMHCHENESIHAFTPDKFSVPAAGVVVTEAK